MFVKAFRQYRLAILYEMKEFDLGQKPIFTRDRLYRMSDGLDDRRRIPA